MTHGSLDGKLIGRLPGVVVVDQSRLLEGASGSGLDCKWMVDLLHMVEGEMEMITLISSECTRVYAVSGSQQDDFEGGLPYLEVNTLRRFCNNFANPLNIII